jgi:polysaccharide export outer membrane protein
MMGSTQKQFNQDRRETNMFLNKGLTITIMSIWIAGATALYADNTVPPETTPQTSIAAGTAGEKPSNTRADEELPFEEYRLGAGDVLNISVWKDESLTRQVTILPDGTISFPLVGRARAEGLTIEELKKEVIHRLRKYVPEPVLSVEVMRINSMMVYVIGKVNRPGRFELIDEIDVMQALALAGGLNPFAKTSKIRIFRKNGAQTHIFSFDYDDVAQGENLEQNLLLQRGDVIVVP